MNPTPPPPIDEELAALRAGRTSAACAKIVSLHGPLVMSACRRVLRDEGLAEDAAQETFVLLVKKVKSLPPGTSLAGWLYHAACRTALNHQRTAMRRRVRETSAEAQTQMTPDTQPNLWAEIESHLDDAMLALPERQRDLVVQCYFQNRSQRSAAAALGCSESVVSRELGAAIEGLRQFFAKRRVAVGGAALAGLLSSHAASAAMAGGATMVTAMMATTTTSTLLAAFFKSKAVLTSAAVVCTATVATLGYHLASQTSGLGPHGSHATGRNTLSPGAGAGNATGSQATAKAGGAGARNGAAGKGGWRGKWEAKFQFTSAMALDAQKKQVLLETDPDARYALLQKMGIGLSRAAFDALIAQGMDASVAPWRDTFSVLASRTDMFDNYLMAWSNEDPLAALNWVTAQPDGGLGMRKQLLYALEAGQLQADTLGDWIGSLTSKSLQKEAALAMEWLRDPSSLIAHMGKGGNEGFLVDLAMLKGGGRLDWTAFGSKLAAGKTAIVARAMRLALDGGIAQPHLDQMIQGLAGSADPNIGIGAVTILRAARGDTGVNYLNALQLAALCDQAGMSDFKTAIYQGWALADPNAALQHTGRLKDLAHMRSVLRGLPAVPDDATLLAWMAGTPTKAQDIALAAIYGRGTGSPFEQLDKILQSPVIVDRVEAAMEMLRMVPLSDAVEAARWLMQQPKSQDSPRMALALVRRLAVVDPQAALDLVHGAGMRGRDYEESVFHAVTQFAAQNDLAQSTQFIQQLTDSRTYADALGHLAMVKYPGHPQEAFVYLQQNSRGDWQPAALRMLSDLYYNKLGNIDANAAEILNLDLPRLGGEVASRASILCKVWIDHQVPLEVPLAWTQQLPPAQARETRLQLARNKDLKPATVQQFQAWAQQAAISPAERSQLITVLTKRP